MTLLLSKQIDVAEAMIYNEYAQVLEATNPETGDLYQPTDLNVINYNDEGTAMLQDALFSRASWLAEAGQRGHRQVVPEGLVPGLDLLPGQPGRLHPVHGRRGLHARRRPPGLDDERDQPADLAVARTASAIMDPALWQQTVDVVGRCRDHPRGARRQSAYRTDLAEAALAELADADTTGASFTKGDGRGHPGRQLGSSPAGSSRIRTAGALAAPAVLRLRRRARMRA